MNPNPPCDFAHLSDDELDDVLIGAGSSEAEAHLAACSACTHRKAEFGAAIASFNQATLAWSEAKSHTLTRDLLTGREEPSATRHFGLAVAGLCGVVVVGAVLSAGLPGTSGHPQSGDQAGSVPAQSSLTDRDREIAGDNAMLEEIDAALHRPEPSPEQTYRLSQAPDVRRSADSEVRE